MCARWCVYTCRGVHVCLHVSAWECAVTSADKLYCYYGLLVGCARVVSWLQGVVLIGRGQGL